MFGYVKAVWAVAYLPAPDTAVYDFSHLVPHFKKRSNLIIHPNTQLCGLGVYNPNSGLTGVARFLV